MDKLFNIPLTRVDNDADIIELKRNVLSLCTNNKSDEFDLVNAKFPGCLPMEISRSDFDKLRNVKYWVCEKSDGIRAFMFLNENQIYFVDRRFDFYRLEEENFIIPEANNLDIMQNQVRTPRSKSSSAP
jgi:hypothetical protein